MYSYFSRCGLKKLMAQFNIIREYYWSVISRNTFLFTKFLLRPKHCQSDDGVVPTGSSWQTVIVCFTVEGRESIRHTILRSCLVNKWGSNIYES